MFLLYLQEGEFSASHSHQANKPSDWPILHFGAGFSKPSLPLSDDPRPVHSGTLGYPLPRQSLGVQFLPCLSHLYGTVPASLSPIRFLSHDSDTGAQYRPKLLERMQSCLSGPMTALCLRGPGSQRMPVAPSNKSSPSPLCTSAWK